MKYFYQEIENELINQGAQLIRFVDISHLSETQNRQFPNAIVFALPLTTGYIKVVCDTPNYVQARIDDNFNFDDDEYLITENKTHELADYIATYVTEKGTKHFHNLIKVLLTRANLMNRISNLFCRIKP